MESTKKRKQSQEEKRIMVGIQDRMLKRYYLNNQILDLTNELCAVQDLQIKYPKLKEPFRSELANHNFNKES